MGLIVKEVNLLLFSFSDYEVARKVLGLQETCWYVLPINNINEYNLK